MINVAKAAIFFEAEKNFESDPVNYYAGVSNVPRMGIKHYSITGATAIKKAGFHLPF